MSTSPKTKKTAPKKAATKSDPKKTVKATPEPADTNTAWMAPESLRMDGAAQPRESISPDLVDDYAEAMVAGVKFPAIVAFCEGGNDGTGPNGDIWVADGFHRTLAAIKANLGMTIEVEVRVGTLRDAILYSVGANASHGLRRANADKRRAVLTLLNDEEWGQWSNEAIAKKCGVDPQTVANHRPQSRNSGLTDVKTVNKHGQETTRSAHNSRVDPDVQANGHAVTADLVNPPEPGQGEPADAVETEDTPGAVPVSRKVEKPEFSGDEPEPVKGDRISDEDWLAGLPFFDKLPAKTREIGVSEALCYREVVESEEHDAAMKLLKRLERKHKSDIVKPESLYRLSHIKIKHPKEWLICSLCDGKGCDTDKQRGCRRRGFVIPY